MKKVKLSILSFFKAHGYLLLILFFTILSFMQIIHFDFLLWDDDALITKNIFVKHLSISSLNHNYETNRFTFIPLSIYSFMYNIWGENPMPFHLLSLVTHLLNIILAYKLLKKFKMSNISLAIVLTLFALHPMRAESVAWISEFKGLLSTFFTFISFHLYIKYILSNQKSKYLIFTTFLIIIASMSKIHGVVIPLLLVLFDIYYNREDLYKSILEKSSMFLILFLAFFTSVQIQIIGYFSLASIFLIYSQKKEVIHKILKSFTNRQLKSFIFISSTLILLIFIYLNKSIFELSLWDESRYTYLFYERFFLAGHSLWFYISTFLLPINLNPVHPYPIRLPNNLLPLEYQISIIVLLCILAISIYLIYKRKEIPKAVLFGWFFFLINISLFLHFIPIQGRIIVADRYSYLAHFGLGIFFITSIEKLLSLNKKHNTTTNLFFLIILITLSLSTYKQTKLWANSRVLFTYILEKNEKISFIYSNLGAEYMHYKDYKNAILMYNKAIEIDSLDSYAHFNRALVFNHMGDYNKTISDFSKAIAINDNPKFKALSYTHLGNIHASSRKDSMALEYFNKAINQYPGLSFTYNKLGIFYLNRNFLDSALTNFQKASKIDPFSAEAYNNIGSVLLAKGKTKEALANFDKAINIEPDFTIAYFNRGFLKYNNYNAAESLEDFDKAIELNNKFHEAYIQRGRVHAYLRNYHKAINDFSTVLVNDSLNYTALTNRAFAYYYINDTARSRKDFIKNTETYPTNHSVWQNLGWYYLKIRDFENSIKMYEKSLLVNNSQIIPLINISRMHIETKNFAKANKSIESAYSLDSLNHEVLFLKAEINRINGNLFIACEFYQKASNMGDHNAKKAITQYCKKSD